MRAARADIAVYGALPANARLLTRVWALDRVCGQYRQRRMTAPAGPAASRYIG